MERRTGLNRRDLESWTHTPFTVSLLIYPAQHFCLDLFATLDKIDACIFPAREFYTCVFIPPQKLRLSSPPWLKKPIPASSIHQALILLPGVLPEGCLHRTYWPSGSYGFKEHALIHSLLCCCILEREILLLSNKNYPGRSHKISRQLWNSVLPDSQVSLNFSPHSLTPPLKLLLDPTDPLMCSV